MAEQKIREGDKVDCPEIPEDERKPLGSQFAAAVAALTYRCTTATCRVQTYKGNKCPACYGAAPTVHPETQKPTYPTKIGHSYDCRTQA